MSQMNFKQFTFSLRAHKNNNVIWIHFPYQQKLINDLKKRFPSAKWSQSKKAWYLPDLPALRTVLGINKVRAHIKWADKIHPINNEALHKFYEQLELKAYSPNTIRMYVADFSHLLILLKHNAVDDLSHNRLKDYFLYHFCVFCFFVLRIL